MKEEKTMREIKFRAWDKRLKSWAEDGMGVYMEGLLDCDTEPLVPEINRIFEWNEDLIWMQYTGLKDKNGKEIYEGDIVDATKTGYPKWIGQIIFNSVFAGFQVLDEESDIFDIDDDVEIIGNIYENPELLTYKYL